MHLIAFITCLVFIVLALWHFRMACFPHTGESAAVPSVVVPSINVTEPVGVPAGVGVTVAVKVIDCATFEGFAEDVNAVDVAPFTACVSAADILPVKLASPA